MLDDEENMVDLLDEDQLNVLKYASESRLKSAKDSASRYNSYNNRGRVGSSSNYYRGRGRGRGRQNYGYDAQRNPFSGGGRGQSRQTPFFPQDNRGPEQPFGGK